MRYLHWFLSFALVYLLGACSSTEDNGDMVPAPNTVEQMLELSSGFVITNFADYRQTTAEEPDPMPACGRDAVAVGHDHGPSRWRADSDYLVFL